MIKATTVFATLFFLTCLGLAVLSSQKGKSLMSAQVAPETSQAPISGSVDAVAVEADANVAGDAAATNEIPMTAPREETLPDDVSAGTIPENK